MIGRRCKASNGFSRPVLIARDLFCKPEFLSGYLSQVKYCGGYSGEDPPLTIPNREVKLTSADGTATPSGRVGSCRFSEHLIEVIQSGVLFLYYRRDTIPEPSPHFAVARGDGLILIPCEAPCADTTCHFERSTKCEVEKSINISSFTRFLRALRLVEMTKRPFAWSESQERELSRNDSKGICLKRQG